MDDIVFGLDSFGDVATDDRGQGMSGGRRSATP